MIVTIGGLVSSQVVSSLSCARIDSRFASRTSVTERSHVSFSRVTPNSSQINWAVSKSILAWAATIILFIKRTFITSGRGTHIFSENSFTVIVSHKVIVSFFLRLSDTLYVFGLLDLVCCAIMSLVDIVWLFCVLHSWILPGFAGLCGLAGLWLFHHLPGLPVLQVLDVPHDVRRHVVVFQRGGAEGRLFHFVNLIVHHPHVLLVQDSKSFIYPPPVFFLIRSSTADVSFFLGLPDWFFVGSSFTTGVAFLITLASERTGTAPFDAKSLSFTEILCLGSFVFFSEGFFSSSFTDDGLASFLFFSLSLFSFLSDEESIFWTFSVFLDTSRNVSLDSSFWVRDSIFLSSTSIPSHERNHAQLSPPNIPPKNHVSPVSVIDNWKLNFWQPKKGQ